LRPDLLSRDLVPFSSNPAVLLRSAVGCCRLEMGEVVERGLADAAALESGRCGEAEHWADHAQPILMLQALQTRCNWRAALGWEPRSVAAVAVTV